MKVSNNASMTIETLKNAAKNSPGLASDSQNKSSHCTNASHQHTHTKAPKLVETAKIDGNSLQEISPGVIYHGADDDIPDIDRDLDISGIRLFKYHNFSESEQDSIDRRAERNVHFGNYFQLEQQMKPLYADFKREVDDLHPELAKKDYGISVNEDGALMIVNNRNNLSEQEEQDLNDVLNNFSGATALTAMANDFAESVIKTIELDRRPDGTGITMGKFDVSKENFHDIIDLVPRIKENEWGNSFNAFDIVDRQIVNKAELINNHHQVEEYISGEWISVEI